MNEAAANRKLATIVAVDVAGFSARAEADEASAIDTVAALRAAVTGAAETYGGRVFNSAGDGFMVEFPTVSGAVAAALALVDGAGPPVRVGVHLGEVSQVPGGDLLGHGVNVAARLEAMAPPGGVLISAAARQALRGPDARRFKPQGEARLDKMHETMPVFAFVPPGGRPKILRRRRWLAFGAVALTALAAGVAAAIWITQRPASPRPLHVAVAAFQPFGREDIVVSLARSLPDAIRGNITGAGVEPLAPGAPTPADLVVGGVVNLEGGNLHVSTQISDARRQVTLWSAAFDAPPQAPAVLRDRVAVGAAAVVACAAKARRPGAGEIATEALRSFLKACALSDDPKASETARALYRDAIEQAPTFAPALSSLARMSALTIRDGASEEAPQMRREAADYAHRALAIDPRDGSAFQALEMAVVPISRWDERQRLLSRGLTVDPSNADLAYEQGRVLVALGRIQEALIYQGRAVALDPHSATNAAQLANSLAASGDATAAETAIERAYQLWPDNDQVRAVRFWIAAWTGRDSAALQMLDDPNFATWISNGEQRGIWSAILRAHQSRDLAQKAEARRRLLESEARGDFPPWSGAQLLALLGFKDDAFAMVDRVSRRAPDRDPVFLFRAPMSPLQRDPRFMVVAERFGLVSYWRKTDRWPDFCADPALPYDCRAVAGKTIGQAP